MNPVLTIKSPFPTPKPCKTYQTRGRVVKNRMARLKKYEEVE